MVISLSKCKEKLLKYANSSCSTKIEQQALAGYPAFDNEKTIIPGTSAYKDSQTTFV